MAADPRVRMRLDTNQFESGVDRIFGKMSRLGTRIAATAAVAVTLATSVLGVAGGIGAVTKAINNAAEFEQIETSFITLLGSVEAAQQRIDELSKFAAATPFEMPEIARASRTLETLTRGALATGKGLELVGDVASAVNRPFDEVATTIGRLYDGLQSGRPVGEAMMRLQELGVISGDTRNELEALQKSGADSAQVWAVAEKALGRFSGNMERQSKTWNGLLSTLNDNVNLAFAAVGAPVIDALKPALEALIGFSEQLAPQAEAFGQRLAHAINIITAAFSSGTIEDMLYTALEIAFKQGINVFMAGLQGAAAFLVSFWESLPQIIEKAVSLLSDGEFWGGLGQILDSIAKGFVATLAEGLAPLVDKLLGLLRKLPGIGEIFDFNAQDLAEQLGNEAAKNWKEGIARVAGAGGSDLFGQYLANMQKALQEFQEAFANAPEFLGTGDAQQRLAALVNAADQLVAQNQSSVGNIPQITPDENAQSALGRLGDLGNSNAPSTSRLSSIGGFGVFVTDPLLQETRSMRQVLQKIERNTANNTTPQNQPAQPSGPLVFAT